MIAFAGRVGEDVEALFDEGFSQIVSINKPDCDLATALKNAEQNLQNSCEDITRLLLLKHTEQA